MMTGHAEHNETITATTGTQTFDFIDTYVKYADVTEAPPILHKAVAEQLIASVLNSRGVTIKHGALRHTLDLWQVLLTPSGVGRNTALEPVYCILQQADLEQMFSDNQWGSPPAMYQHLADPKHPHTLTVWSEMSELLAMLNEKSFRGAKRWLTDRYDNLRKPKAIIFRETGNTKKDTPPIIFGHAPRTNILATSSQEWFFSELQQEDSAGGFVPRWIINRAADGYQESDIAIPLAHNSELEWPLAATLTWASGLQGEADISQIHRPYIQWYSETKRRFRQQPNPALSMPFFRRHQVHVLKLAVIYQVSSSLDLRVSLPAWERAVERARQVEQTIFELLPTGMNKEGHELSKMEDKVRSGGVHGVTLSEFTRAFQSVETRKREGALRTFAQAGAVRGFARATAGRSALVLVHVDSVSKYVARYPNDLETDVGRWLR